MNVFIGEVPVKGVRPDKQTRCAHYHKKEDIVAFQFQCCDEFFCCYKCHQELTNHPIEPQPLRQQNHLKTVLCGFCKTLLTIKEYLHSGYACPVCSTSFNPGCQHHYHIYFK
ncbi:CHY zinc finger protein [Alteribacillus persepolensis]|uniref:CHY zinc finger protein n=1 Tax=Alteribacillus persepolensis TaxID=568899 RepID=UPI000B8199EE|nr:CHY zinc finger protein [Alteribacillus persepolensis]